jgi:hypothetical protein
MEIGQRIPGEFGPVWPQYLYCAPVGTLGNPPLLGEMSRNYSGRRPLPCPFARPPLTSPSPLHCPSRRILPRRAADGPSEPGAAAPCRSRSQRATVELAMPAPRRSRGRSLPCGRGGRSRAAIPLSAALGRPGVLAGFNSYGILWLTFCPATLRDKKRWKTRFLRRRNRLRGRQLRRTTSSQRGRLSHAGAADGQRARAASGPLSHPAVLSRRERARVG